MTPDRQETSLTRQRLSGRTEQRGSQTGFSTLGALIFGGIFVLFGTLVIFVGTKVIPVDPKDVHAPYWVLTVFGAVFALAGLMVWVMAWRQYAARQRQESLQTSGA
jgi:protein-S-isoprenylcysteine O-methyltransferase Ste14